MRDGEDRGKKKAIMSKQLDDNAELFRIMPLERFLQMLVEGRNTLVSPLLWDDPFEVLFDEDFIEEINKRHEIETDAPIYRLNYNNWFAQCWSMVSESDALWRVFSKNTTQRCVKIKTTVAELNKITHKQDNDTKFYLQAVKYGNIEDGSYMEGDEEWEDILPYDDENEDLLNLEARILLMKRNAFESEKEVRLLVHVNNLDKDLNVYSYEVNPLELITEVQLDPWTPKETFKAIEIAINACAPHGINKIKVKPSVLYDGKISKRILLDKIYST